MVLMYALPENHIVIDFDLKIDLVKSLGINLEAASKMASTYADSVKWSCIHLFVFMMGHSRFKSYRF
jgi:hypothetical protein